MAAGDPIPDGGPPVIPTWRRIREHLWRATCLRCPVCGTKPIFLPLSRTRSLRDWFTPLDGCPRCGYPYEREPGYFLMSVWAIGYGISALVGIVIYVYLQMWHSDLSLTVTLLAVGVPLPIINVLFARHAKAYFLAIDHLCDPYIPGSDDDDGGGGSWKPTPAPPAPAGIPEPGEPVAREEIAAPALR
jgi:hypothetical protein